MSMIKYASLLLTLLLLGCNSKEKQNFTLQANITEAGKNMYYLYELGDTIPLIIDSAYIENTELNFNTHLNHSYN